MCMLFVLACLASNGQELMGQRDSSQFHYDLRLDLSGRLIGGTFEQLVFNNSLDLKVENKRWSFQNATSYRFNRTGNAQVENNWYELFSASWLNKKKLFFPTVFYHYDNNLMFRVNARHLFGGGLSSVKSWEGHALRLDVGAGYDYTDYNGSQFENSPRLGPIRRRSLLMFRLTHENKFFQGKVALANDFFYRHSLVERSDYLFILQPKVSFAVSTHLNTSVGFEYRFENVHLLDLSRFNSILVYGLAFQLGK